jgi:hypothetical protein
LRRASSEKQWMLFPFVGISKKIHEADGRQLLNTLITSLDIRDYDYIFPYESQT